MAVDGCVQIAWNVQIVFLLLLFRFVLRLITTEYSDKASEPGFKRLLDLVSNVGFVFLHFMGLGEDVCMVGAAGLLLHRV